MRAPGWKDLPSVPMGNSNAPKSSGGSSRVYLIMPTICAGEVVRKLSKFYLLEPVKCKGFQKENIVIFSAYSRWLLSYPVQLTPFLLAYSLQTFFNGVFHAGPKIPLQLLIN